MSNESTVLKTDILTLKTLKNHRGKIEHNHENILNIINKDKVGVLYLLFCKNLVFK